MKWHDLRHCFTTRLVESGLPAQQVMKITGHTQMTTFLRYITANDDVARKGASALDDLVQLQAEAELNASSNEFVN